MSLYLYEGQLFVLHEAPNFDKQGTPRESDIILFKNFVLIYISENDESIIL